jgi:hypothetical protein
MAGRSAAASLAAVAVNSGNTPALEISCGRRVALSINTSRDSPPVARAASVNRATATSRFDRADAASRHSMLGERSSNNSTVSGAPLNAQPNHPPTSGRAIASTNAAIANARHANTSQCRSFADRRDRRDAASKNDIAAQSSDRYRIRFSRWITTGTATSANPQRTHG